MDFHFCGRSLLLSYEFKFKREMSGNISGGTESLNYFPDWPKQSDKIVTGIFSCAATQYVLLCVSC